MELRHLRYFVSVVDCGSFTAAAEYLHTVQPSLSRQIRDLEAAVGVPLFERAGRRVALTESGRVFLDEARLTLAQAERAVERARRASGRSGHLGIGFDYGMESEAMARVTQALQGRIHTFDLALRNQPSPTLLEELKARKLDAAFVLVSDFNSPLQFRVLHRDRMVVALPKRHSLARRKRVRLEDLAQLPLVTASISESPVIYVKTLEYAISHGFAVKPAFEVESMLTALSLVESANGYCLLPEYSRWMFTEGVVAVSLPNGAPCVDLCVAWHPENHSPALEELLTGLERSTST